MKKIVYYSLFVFIAVFIITSCKQSSSKGTYSDITVEQAQELMKDSKVIFLDVRTPSEIAEGKIEGAKEIDFRSPDFEANISKLDKTLPYVVYCRSGGRSAKAASMMVNKDFKNVKNMLGGYSAIAE